jgi:putative endonuclease
VHYEATTDIFGALEREKEIKGWSRAKKDLLINTLNPFREDLLPMIM